MEFPLYNQNADNIGTTELPDTVFGLPMNKDLLYQVVTSQIANKRKNIAHTKQRGEVRGGGKKPWKQKGTGRARHGSIRSPIWKGGGVAFGPRSERVFKKKINKKMAQKALFVAMSSKIKDGELLVINFIDLDVWKTKKMAGMINKISELFSVKKGSLLLVTPNKNKDTIRRVAQNLSNVDVVEAVNLNALDVMARKNLLIVKDAVEILAGKAKAKN